MIRQPTVEVFVLLPIDQRLMIQLRGIIILLVLFTDFRGYTQIPPTEHILSPDHQSVSNTLTSDMNGDGTMDIVVSSFVDGRISWYSNNGSAVFSIQDMIAVESEPANDLQAVDLDADNDTDLIAIFRNIDMVGWYENDGLGNFTPLQTLTTQVDAPEDVSSADLDGDGDTDLLVTSKFDDEVSWFENLGGGLFGVKQVISSTLTGASIVLAFDVDTDGDMDVCASASDFSSELVWYENNGLAQFGFAQLIDSLPSSGAKALYPGDLDGDGHVDLAVVDGANGISWYPNSGLGSFDTIQVIGAPYSSLVGVEDYDDDGDLDLLSWNFAQDELEGWANNDTGAFSPAQQLLSDLDVQPILVMEDLNNDGAGDFVIGELSDNDVLFSENLGNGLYLDPLSITHVVKQPLGVNSVDLDGDGDVDILTTSFTESAMLWFQNDGTGLFSGSLQINGTPLRVSSFDPADVDGDGDMDVFLGMYWDDRIAWLENIGGGQFAVLPHVVDSISYVGVVEFKRIDADVLPDLVVHRNFGGNNVIWYRNQGGGNFAPVQSIALPTGVEELSIGDLDGDGLLDIVFSFNGPWSGYQLYWMPNLGVGNFGAPILLVDSVGLDNAPVITDMDGDGDNDIAMQIHYPYHEFVWYENNGAGNMVSEILIDTISASVNSFNLFDLDGDSDMDLVSGMDSQGLIWYENDGSGNFPTPATVHPNGDVQAISSGDFNGDGIQNIVISSVNGDKVAWYGSLMASVGITEMMTNDVQVFPNPTSGSVTIISNVSMERIRVFGTDGRLMIDRVMNGPLSSTLSLNGFGPGLLLLRISTEDGIFTEWVMVD